MSTHTDSEQRRRDRVRANGVGRVNLATGGTVFPSGLCAHMIARREGPGVATVRDVDGGEVFDRVSYEVTGYRAEDRAALAVALEAAGWLVVNSDLFVIRP